MAFTKNKLAYLISLVFLISCSIAFAVAKNNNNHTYDISTEIIIDDNLLASPEIIVRDGGTGHVSFTTPDKQILTLEVLAKELAKEKDVFELNFTVKYKKDQYSLHLNPVFLLRANEKAKIKFKTPAGQSFEMNVSLKVL